MPVQQFSFKKVVQRVITRPMGDMLCGAEVEGMSAIGRVADRFLSPVVGVYFFHHGEHPRISLLVVTKLQRLGSSTEFTVQTNTTKRNEKSLPLQGRRLKPSNDNPSEIKLNNALPCAQQKRN